MALPLPRVVPDVGPGGAVTTAMGGMNALANAMHNRRYNKVKADYAPLTIPAQAYSQLAYANAVAPQILAKIITNSGALANLSEEQKQNVLSKIYQAGTGQNNGLNMLNNLPQHTGIGEPSTNNFSGFVKNALKGMFGKGSAPVSNPFNFAPQMSESNQQLSPAESAANSSPVQRPKEGVTQEGQQWYNSKEEPVYAEEGGSPMELELTGGKQKPSYVENTAKYESILEEGKESGKIRAKNIDELDAEYEQALNAEKPLKHMNEIVTNPVFQKLRSIPGFQELQLNSKEVLGNKEEQKLIGDFRTTALKAVAQTVMGFRGRILQSEVQMANEMKINPKDSISVILGKLPSIETFNEMTKKRANIASKLMREKHINKGQALEIADKQVNGDAIRKRIEMELNPITDDDIDTTAKENGMTREQVIQRLRKEGRYNG